MTPLSEARREAEEALARWDALRDQPISEWRWDAYQKCVDCLRSILAATSDLEALLRECNAVCLCGCPAAEHEAVDEGAEQCEHEDHECIRVAPAVLEIVRRLRERLATAERERDEARAERDRAVTIATQEAVGHSRALSALSRPAPPADDWRHVAAYYLGDYTDTHTAAECRQEAIRRTTAPRADAAREAKRRCACGCEGDPFVTPPPISRPVSVSDANAEVVAALDQHRRFPGPDATRLMAHALETVLRTPALAPAPSPSTHALLAVRQPEVKP